MTKKLEDIISKEYLDRALENAKIWCQENLKRHLQNFKKEIDYNIFQYIIDNELIGLDMCLDEWQEGLIRVSTETLKWYQEREEYYRKDEFYGKIREPVEVDPESMFVHEIVEFIIYEIPQLFLSYLSKMEFPHSIANQIENINRRERGLKEWPKY